MIKLFGDENVGNLSADVIASRGIHSAPFAAIALPDRAKNANTRYGQLQPISLWLRENSFSACQIALLPFLLPVDCDSRSTIRKENIINLIIKIFSQESQQTLAFRQSAFECENIDSEMIAFLMHFGDRVNAFWYGE